MSTFEARVQKHRHRLVERVRRSGSTTMYRGSDLPIPVWAESYPPIGQGGWWYDDAAQCVSLSGVLVARQLARLCGEDSQVTIPWRSLAEAVGRVDSGGRHIAYVQRGVQCLEDAGWLRRLVTGKGRGARTTYFLLPGELADGAALNILDTAA